MINFFSKKNYQKININEKFEWISRIKDQKTDLAKKGFDLRKNHIDEIYNFLEKSEGKELITEFKYALVKTGIPEESVNLELDLLTEIFSPNTINDIFYNPSIGFERHLKYKKFYDTVSISNNYGFIRVPKGLVFIVGSGNTFLPVFTAFVLSYICGNVNVLQLSSHHSDIIQSFFKKIPFQGKDYIHFTNLDHRDNSENECLKDILLRLPWDVVNIWGGEEANYYYYKHLAENKNRPTIINMEPLTGIAIIQKKYLIDHFHEVEIQLSKSISEMGQQLCSSPTEAYIVEDSFKICEGDFFINLVKSLENNFKEYNDDDYNYIKLDRMLSHAKDRGSRVFKSKKYGNKIVLIESNKSSVFSSMTKNSTLSIHERRNFLEFIKVKDLESIANLVNNISLQDTHKNIKKIQTILVFGDNDFINEVILLAKLIGVYRVVDHNYVFRRHTMEPLDGVHLVNEFSYPISVLGSIASEL